MCADVLVVRLERGLGVDDHGAVTRQLHDHIGAQPTVVVVHHHGLLRVLRALLQAALLEDALEHQLSPRTLGPAVSGERTREVHGIFIDALARLHHLLELRTQGHTVLDVTTMRLLHALLQLLDLLAERIGHLAEVQLGVRRKLVRVLLEDLGGDAVELVLELRVHVTLHRQLVRRGAPLLLELSLQACEALTLRRELRVQLIGLLAHLAQLCLSLLELSSASAAGPLPLLSPPRGRRRCSSKLP